MPFTVQVTETATYDVQISDDQAAEILAEVFADDTDRIADYLDTDRDFTAVTDRSISGATPDKTHD
ncbi:hypothetical protein [Streptomyces sp. T028]|uniref:hypothetical protein n=1 Tax=Streptomyces sp. T028 TaxID=3394379 RepID=UPI003A89A4B3